MTGKNIHCTRKIRRSLFEWLLNLCGYKIWPETHNDPRIKGPSPHILTSEQVKEIEKIQQMAVDDGITQKKGIKDGAPSKTWLDS